MNLNLLIIIPAITALGIVFTNGLKQVRFVAFAGAVIQLVLSFVLLFLFQQERNAGNNEQFIFQATYNWFPSININYHIGVDGISIAMILLTAFVVLAGVLVSWRQ